jgi:hypothetical protein
MHYSSRSCDIRNLTSEFVVVSLFLINAAVTSHPHLEHQHLAPNAICLLPNHIIKQPPRQFHANLVEDTQKT